MNIYLTALSDKGKVRDCNEDAVVVCPDLTAQEWKDSGSFIQLGNKGALSIVADGMGGANAGDVASSIVVNEVKTYFTVEALDSLELTENSIKSYIADVIGKINTSIKSRAESDPDTIGLGTTIVLIWVIREKAYIAWCGDSRCYRYNAKQGLKCLTKDHSYVQELIDNGDITPEQAMVHPESSVITRCLGDVDVPSDPEILVYDICDGDILLSCSDGLCGCCLDSEIEKCLCMYGDNIDKCRDHLLALAMNAGGSDNISISLFACQEGVVVSPKKSILSRLIHLFAGR